MLHNNCTRCSNVMKFCTCPAETEFRINYTLFYTAPNWEYAKRLAERDGHLVDSISTREMIFVQSERKDMPVWI